MNEEVSQKTVRFAINTGKLTGRVLWKCLKAYLRHRQNRKNTAGKGEQTVKQLVKYGREQEKVRIGRTGSRKMKTGWTADREQEDPYEDS